MGVLKSPSLTKQLISLARELICAVTPPGAGVVTKGLTSEGKDKYESRTNERSNCKRKKLQQAK